MVTPADTGAVKPEPFCAGASGRDGASGAAGASGSVSTGACGSGVVRTGVRVWAADREARSARGSSAFAVLLAPRVSFRPGWMSAGSLPMTSRLSAYSFFQPPRMFLSWAILAR